MALAIVKYDLRASQWSKTAFMMGMMNPSCKVFNFSFCLQKELTKQIKTTCLTCRWLQPDRWGAIKHVYDDTTYIL